MIEARGWDAIIGNEKRKERHAVVAWRDDGCAMIASDKGHLVVAEDEWGFQCIDISEANSVIVAATPGWVAHCKGDDGEPWTAPVIAWGFDPSGTLGVPLVLGGDGVVEQAHHVHWIEQTANDPRNVD